MHICTHETQVQATPQALWQIWTNVKNWPTWDKDIQGVEMTGQFRQGATGTISYKDGSTRTFTVIKCEMLESYVLSIPFLHGTELLVKRSLQQKGPEVHFEQDINISGKPFAKLMLKGRKDGLASASEQQMRLVLSLLQGEYSPFQDGATGKVSKQTY